jgi:hypothetical protein
MRKLKVSRPFGEAIGRIRLIRYAGRGNLDGLYDFGERKLEGQASSCDRRGGIYRQRARLGIEPARLYGRGDFGFSGWRGQNR